MIIRLYLIPHFIPYFHHKNSCHSVFFPFPDTAMKITTKLAFHSFELAYLGVLAILPFVVSIRIVATTLITCLLCVGLVALYRKLSRKCVKGVGQTVVISGCDTGKLRVSCKLVDMHLSNLPIGYLRIRKKGT